VIIGILVGRLEEEHQFTIDWGAETVCMIGSVSVSAIFLEIKRNLRRWRMREFPMSSYFGEATTTSPMVSRGVDKDTEKKATSRVTRITE